MVPKEKVSPSATRRQALKEADAGNQLRVLDSYPLDKYVDIAQQLLDRFQIAVDQRQLDEAYIYGHRFAHLTVQSLPQHAQWKCSRPNGTSLDAKRKKRLNDQVEKVLSMMEVIVQRMDAEELVKERERRKAKEMEEQMKRQREETQRQKEKEQRDALEEERQKFMADQKRKNDEQKQKDVEKSAMAKLFALNAKAEKSSMSSAQKKSGKTKKAGKGESSVSAQKKQTTTVTAKKKQTPTITTTTVKPHGNKVNPQQKQSLQNESMGVVSSDVPAKNQELPKPNKLVSNDEKTLNNEGSKATSGPTFPNKTSNQQKTAKKLGIDLNSEQRQNASEPTETDVDTTIKESSTKSRSNKFRRDQMKLHQMEESEKSVALSASPKGDTVVLDHRPGEIETQLRDSLRQNARHAVLSPLSSKEQKIIDLLQKNINAQESRLEEIEEKQIPHLLSMAKSHLKGNQKKEALKCVAHKKRLEQQVDVIKGSIFKMETQMFMIENAMEDRHVKKALDEAASALSGLQQSIGDPNATIIDLTSMNLSLPTTEVIDETDEELMEELEDWVTPAEQKRKSKQDAEDSVSILSLPSVPSTTPLPEGSVQQIVNAVLGS